MNAGGQKRDRVVVVVVEGRRGTGWEWWCLWAKEGGCGTGEPSTKEKARAMEGREEKEKEGEWEEE